MEFFVTKELELPEALCFILLGGGSFSRRRQFATLSQF